MTKSVDLHEEARKKGTNVGKFESCQGSYEQRWSRNWEIFARAEIQKHSMQDWLSFKHIEEILWVTERVQSSWKHTYHSGSLKRQRETCAILPHHELGTSAQSEEDQVSSSTTTHSKISSQSNKSSLRQFLPERALTISKAAHSTSTFSVVISRRLQGWIRTDRWVI